MPELDPARRAFYQYHRCLTEPWDGPASLVFSDGTPDRRARSTATACGPGRYVDHARRPGRDGQRGRRPADRSREGPAQGAAPARQDLPGRYRQRPDHRRRRVQGLESAAASPTHLWLEQNQLELDDLPEPGRLPRARPGATPAAPAARSATPRKTSAASSCRWRRTARSRSRAWGPTSRWPS